MTNKKNKLLRTLGGILLVFGLSGLIYSLLPFPFIIGLISTILGFILIVIISELKKKKK